MSVCHKRKLQSQQSHLYTFSKVVLGSGDKVGLKMLPIQTYDIPKRTLRGAEELSVNRDRRTGPAGLHETLDLGSKYERLRATKL